MDESILTMIHKPVKTLASRVKKEISVLTCAQ